MDLREMGYDAGNSTARAQDRDHQGSYVRPVKNVSVLYKPINKFAFENNQNIDVRNLKTMGGSPGDVSETTRRKGWRMSRALSVA